MDEIGLLLWSNQIQRPGGAIEHIQRLNGMRYFMGHRGTYKAWDPMRT